MGLPGPSLAPGPRRSSLKRRPLSQVVAFRKFQNAQWQASKGSNRWRLQSYTQTVFPGRARCDAPGGAHVHAHIGTLTSHTESHTHAHAEAQRSRPREVSVLTSEKCSLRVPLNCPFPKCSHCSSSIPRLRPISWCPDGLGAYPSSTPLEG